MLEATSHERLMKVRVAVQSKVKKKSGINIVDGYEWFELSDFLPIATKEFTKNKLCPIFSIDYEEICGEVVEVANLRIVDATSNSNTIIFSTPTAEVWGTKKMSPIMKLGAKHTYLKRYLYINALELCESDIVNKVKPEVEKINEKQIDRILELLTDDNEFILSRRNISDSEQLEAITSSEAETIINELEEFNND